VDLPEDPGADEPDAPRIHVILNWFQELQRLVPVD